MINLLPPQIKEQITYARRNTQIRRWSLALLAGIAGIAGVVFGGHIYIDQSIRAYQDQVVQTKSSLTSQKLEETQKNVGNLSSTLKLVLQVLSREVLFSRLLKQAGAAMPPGAVLQGLSFNNLEGGIDLQAVAKDYHTGTQVQVNMEDPANKIFEKADIISINCANDKAADPNYPCSVSIRALFANDNSYTFVPNDPGSTKE